MGPEARANTDDEGRGEREDAQAGLDYLAVNYPGEPITLCGFSFGARVGLEVGGSADERVVRMISIGTPVDKGYDFAFPRAVPQAQFWFRVQGDVDEYGDIDRLRELVAKRSRRRSNCASSKAPAISLTIGPG